MNVENILRVMRELADRPEYVVGLFVTVCLLNLVPWRGTWAQGLKFPSALFLLRLIVLYLPVSGTMSTVDRVVFWSLGAYIYFIIIFILMGIVVFHVLATTKRSGPDERNRRSQINLTTGITCYVALTMLSTMCLPIDGLSHIYLPALAVLGSVKVLFVSPLLLPLAWFALLIQVGVLAFSGNRAGREINKLVLTVLVLGGIVQFGYQAVNFEFSERVALIKDKWTPPVSAGQPFPPPDEEMTGFLQAWARQLPRTVFSGVNLVEKESPRSYSSESLPPMVQDVAEGATIKQQMALIPDIYSKLTIGRFLRRSLPVSGLVILLLVVAERVRSGDEADATLGQARTREIEDRPKE